MRSSILSVQVVEWSHSQGCFHRQTLDGMLRDNLSAFVRKVPSDYIPIGIFQTDAEVSAFLEKVYQVLDRSS